MVVCNVLSAERVVGLCLRFQFWDAESGAYLSEVLPVTVPFFHASQIGGAAAGGVYRRSPAASTSLLLSPYRYVSLEKRTDRFFVCCFTASR